MTASSYYEIELFPPPQKIPPPPPHIPPPPTPCIPDSEHYRQISKAIIRGQIVPFLGTEINLCGRQEDADLSSWKPESQYPPSRSELAVFLEKKILGEHWFLTSLQCPLCEPTSIAKANLPSNCPLNQNALLARLYFQHVSLFANFTPNKRFELIVPLSFLVLGAMSH